MSDWQVSPGLAGGRACLLYSDPADPLATIGHVALLGWRDGRIAAIRDFKFAAYVMEDLAVRRL